MPVGRTAEALRVSVSYVSKGLGRRRATGELRRWLTETHKVSASEGLMHKTLAALGLTYKKRRCMPRSKSAPMLQRRGLSGAAISRA
jgi:ribosomal protein L3